MQFCKESVVERQAWVGLSDPTTASIFSLVTQLRFRALSLSSSPPTFIQAAVIRWEEH